MWSVQWILIEIVILGLLQDGGRGLASATLRTRLPIVKMRINEISTAAMNDLLPIAIM